MRACPSAGAPAPRLRSSPPQKSPGPQTTFRGGHVGVDLNIHDPHAVVGVFGIPAHRLLAKVPAGVRGGVPLWRREAQCSRPHACRRTGVLRNLTCRSCLSRVNEVNAASSAAGRLREHRRGVGAKRRPPQWRAAPHTRRRLCSAHPIQARSSTFDRLAVRPSRNRACASP